MTKLNRYSNVLLILLFISVNLVMEHKAEAAAIAAAGVAVYKTATVVYSYFATKTAA